jgi:hypothetical protein
MSLRRGDVRVTNGSAPYSASVEIFDGAEWLLVNGVTAVRWSCDANTPIPRMHIEVMPRAAELLAPSDQPGLSILVGERGRGT